MSPTLFLSLFLMFFIIEFLVNWILDVLNQKEIKANAQVPDFFKTAISPEEYKQSQTYSLVNIKFSKWERGFSTLLTLLILFSGILPWYNQYLEQFNLNPALTGVTFFFGLFGVLSLSKYPLSLYQTFNIESRFGFNQSTLGLFFKDSLKTVFISAMIGAPFLYLVLWFIQSSGAYWWLGVFCLLASFQLLMMIIYPVLVAPLFNKFEPLEAGDLKTQLKSLADKVKFPNKDIYVMDGSQRSSHSNAYFTGFGKMRRVVLYDTLIAQMSTEELKGILCHEMGHYKKGHIYKMLVTSFIIQFLGLFLFSKMIHWQPLYTAFGFESSPAQLTHVGLFLFMTIISTFTFLLGPLLNYRSRVHEFEADAFAIKHIENKSSMESALLKLAKKNLSNLTPHKWYSAFHYSHPTMYERIKALRRALKADNRVANPIV